MQIFTSKTTLNKFDLANLKSHLELKAKSKLNLSCDKTLDLLSKLNLQNHISLLILQELKEILLKL